MIRKSAPVNLVVHSPQTETGRKALARQTAQLHADAVLRRLKMLSCPHWQKQALLDEIAKLSETQNREQV